MTKQGAAFNKRALLVVSFGLEVVFPHYTQLTLRVAGSLSAP